MLGDKQISAKEKTRLLNVVKTHDLKRIKLRNERAHQFMDSI